MIDCQQRAPILTWIIPVYNGEKYIGQAIESILRQPCKDFRIIVVDDGSTDRTVSVVEKYLGNQVSLIRKENGGVSSARNAGIRAADSKYIAFLDADDVICKDVYTEDFKNLMAEEKYDLFSFSFFVGDQELRYGNRITVTDGDVHCDKLKLDPYKSFASFIYHQQILNGENAVSFPEGIKYAEDTAFVFLAYQRAQKIRNIDRYLFVYRNNILSATHQNKNTQYIIQHIIPAWEWAKRQCVDDSAKDLCDIHIFASVAEYLQLSCISGMPLSEINSIFTSPAVQEALSKYNILWNSSK